jgi:hypothetical protein
MQSSNYVRQPLAQHSLRDVSEGNTESQSMLTVELSTANLRMVEW